MELLAHSARYGYPKQLYKEHVSEVMRMAMTFAAHVLPYISFGELFLSTVRAATEYHDLGKIDSANQKVLRDKPKENLPVKHEDAGTAFLLERHLPAALCVFSHHGGLPSIVEEQVKTNSFRDVRQVSRTKRTVMDITNERLAEYLTKHAAEIEDSVRELSESGRPKEKDSLFYRMALSCLVDADHTDTAGHYGGNANRIDILLHPARRLECLDAYVNSLPFNAEDVAPERLAIRQEFYNICKWEPESRGIYACSMPVGTGKTTSVMYHLLKVGEKFGLRRIFVVLPFTNIIDQSVDTYRKSLILPEEDSESVVAAHHHRAEYENQLLMASSFLWDTPVIVTTAVQFFETLASNHPVSLRKLHNLPGSAIFIDEAHAALPAHMWPQAWKWLQDLVQNWGCHIVLGSGSLSHFWNMEEFSERKCTVPEIAGEDIYKRASNLEHNRIVYRLKKEPMNLNELYHWLYNTLQSPRIVIMNTVQSAAALADKIARENGRDTVEHLSTALTPSDREITLERIKSRLKNKEDVEWTLVATTCAEAGLNLSFRSGARDMSSLGSTIQLGGRVNRQCEYGSNCEVWCFNIRKDESLREHPHFKTSARVLQDFFDEGKISPDFCTEALRMEIRLKNMAEAKDNVIVQAEKKADYPTVADLFKVIQDEETFTVVIDESLKEKIERGGKPTRKDMQTLTVRMRKNQIDALRLPRIRGYEDLFFCYPEYYDDFIGYMKGILRVISVLQEGSIT
ncbi:MAG: CRISPR-associated endonuclease Cas3'' [Deltaproteobacteria bacterium]|nr:CRISPR-associated endonuclease Cas3'' [Deltaproteobacteria bacterium]MBM4346574.1 CRISPR-associated endonuclease Cas3'' [Deltaproteobacteria bacterium]